MSNYLPRFGRALFVMCLVLAIGSSISYAQLPGPSIGFEAGYGLHRQLGSFWEDCGCRVEGGTGSGFAGSALIEFPVFSGLVFGLKAGIDFKNATDTTPASDLRVFSVMVSSSDTIYTLADFSMDRIAVYKLTYLLAAPYLRYQFIREGAFVQIGPAVSLLVANNVRQTRQMPSPLITPRGDTITNPRFPSSGTSEKVVEDGEIPNVKKLRVSALMSAGWNIGIWGFVIAPMVTYDLPLTTIRDQNADGWKISSLYGSVAIRFEL